jgi:hypothetical protein
MNVAMMQPAFLPWQGFFELIYKSDRFIFLDDYQFSVQSYHQRNRLFVNMGQVDWYSVPVRKTHSFKIPLNQTKINENIPWRKKMLKRIQQNYSKAPHYSKVFPYVEKWMETRLGSLAEQNMAFIKIVCELLGFQRELCLSSQFITESGSSERVLELLHWCEADHYYCARGSFDYMKVEGIFPVNGIEVHFQDFKTAKYGQIGERNSFIPSLSILDAMMNVGPGATAELVKGGTQKWLSWEDMLSINSVVTQV